MVKIYFDGKVVKFMGLDKVKEYSLEGLKPLQAMFRIAMAHGLEFVETDDAGAIILKPRPRDD